MSLVAANANAEPDVLPDHPQWTEAPAWRSVGPGWRPLFGSVAGMGFSFEWHDFRRRKDFDWGPTFHPFSIELCLNFEGHGEVGDRDGAVLKPSTAGFYCRRKQSVPGFRRGGEHHRFLTIEFSFDFVTRHLSFAAADLPGAIRAVVFKNRADSWVSDVRPLTARQRESVQRLRHPPIQPAARPLWYQAKALEYLSEFLFPEAAEELFCSRQKRLARERVEKAAAILREDLEYPPPLHELGRRVGCSPFYLSRTFSREMGMTIPQFLRQIRMEKAAELLKAGRLNVTEVALEVGYNSLSHFSQAFCRTMGCCPAIYPLRKNSDSPE